MHERRTSLHAAEKSDRMHRHVRQIERDRLVLAVTEGEQRSTSTAHHLAQFAIMQISAAEFDGGSVGVCRYRLIEQRVECADLERYLPTQSRRIGLLPGKRAFGHGLFLLGKG